MKAIVVGAGLAGLSAAYRLQQAGWQVQVLEASHYAGGRAGTVREGGYLIDTGATQLSSGYRDYLALCEELGIRDQVFPSGQVVAIARKGKLFEIDGGRPLSGALSPVVGWWDKLSIGRTLLDKVRLKPRLDYLNMAASHADDDESFEVYGRRRMSRDAYDFLAAPLLRGNFLRNPDQATKLEWFAITDNFAGQQMLTIRGGITRLPSELARRLDVRLNAPATRVEQVGEQVQVTWTENGEPRQEQVDACVLATRLPESVQLCPSFAAQAAALSARHRYGRGLLVHLGFKQATHSKAIGVFLPQQSSQDIALIWVEHNKNPECAPTGHSLITCYFDDASPNRCYDLDDEHVIGLARTQLEQLFPELQGQCDMARVTRWPMAIPFPQPGVYREIHRLQQQLVATPRIQHAGDYFTCTGQNSAIHHGQRAARALIDTFPVVARA